MAKPRGPGREPTCPLTRRGPWPACDAWQDVPTAGAGSRSPSTGDLQLGFGAADHLPPTRRHGHLPAFPLAHLRHGPRPLTDTKGLLPSASGPHFGAPPPWPHPSSSLPSTQCPFPSLRLVGRPALSPPHTAASSCRPGFRSPQRPPPALRGALAGRPAPASPGGRPLPGAGSLGRMTSRSPVSRLLGLAPGRPGGRAPPDSAVYEPRARGCAPPNGHSATHGPHGRTAASPAPARGRGGGGVRTRKGTGDATRLPTGAPASSRQRPRHREIKEQRSPAGGPGGTRVSR